MLPCFGFLVSLSRHILQPHMFCMVQWAECLTVLMSTYKYLSEESIWRVPAFFHILHPYLVHLVLSGSHSSRVHLLAVIEKYNKLYVCTLVSIHDQTGDGKILYQSPHLFWNPEVEGTNRCENNVVTKAKQERRLLSLIA